MKSRLSCLPFFSWGMRYGIRWRFQFGIAICWTVMEQTWGLDIIYYGGFFETGIQIEYMSRQGREQMSKDVAAWWDAVQFEHESDEE